MSNYTVTTNFGAKDALVSGNPLKLMLGAQFTTEFNNIATAIATKIDAQASGGIALNSPTGGDEGVGTINLSAGYYVNGVALALSGMNVKQKATLTQRNAGTTMTNDPDLVFAIPTAGTYLVRVVCSITPGIGGYNMGLNYSGSFGANLVSIVGPNGPANTAQPITATVNSPLVAVAGAASLVSVILEAVLVATTAGTIGLAWGQQVGNAAVSVLQAGSYMTVVRVA